MALPSWLARRMMFSYSAGSVNGGWVTTGKVSCTCPAVGCWPIWPAPKRAFWLATACWMSLVVIPSEAIRSGFIQIRIAWSGTPKIDACPAPGTRLIGVEDVDVGVIGDVVAAVALVLVDRRR